MKQEKNTYYFSVHANAYMELVVNADSPEEAQRIAQEMVSAPHFVEDHLGQFVIDDGAVIRS